MSDQEKIVFVIFSTRYLGKAPNGSLLRLGKVLSLLDSANLQYRIVSPGKLLLRPFGFTKSLTVFVGYRHTMLINIVGLFRASIWFDAVDSFMLAQNEINRSLFRFLVAALRNRIRPKKELFLLTHISKLDSFFDQNQFNYANRFIFPNLLPKIPVNTNETLRPVFVGHGRYIPNQKAVEFLSTLPLIRDMGGLRVVGGQYPKKLIRKLQHCVNFMGIVEDEKLYFNNDVHFAPILSKAGIKNKVAIPLSLGLRVITTHEGANGLKVSPNLALMEDLDAISRLTVSDITQIKVRNTNLNVFEADDSKEIVKLLETFNSQNE